MQNSNQKPTIVDMLALVRSKELRPVYDENHNVICFNHVGNSTGIQFSTQIKGHMTVGATEEERQEDEKALREFMNTWESHYSPCEVFSMFKTALAITEGKLTEAQLSSILSANQEVKVVEKEVQKDTQYGSLFDNLDGLEISTLRPMMNEAKRKGLRDLYNATRRVLRKKGVSC